MDKRYQIFISSTYTDLLKERGAVIEAILRLRGLPAGMELFQATDDDSWSLIKRTIDECDYYVVIVAGRYGSIHPTEHLSYTELEYRYALEAKKPVLGFLHKDPGQLPANLTETKAASKRKLDAFRDLVKRKNCQFWETPQELALAVTTSLVHAFVSQPGRGWIRASEEDPIEAAQEVIRLSRRNHELESEIAALRVAGFNDGVEIARGNEIHRFDVAVNASEADPSTVKLDLSWDEIVQGLGAALITPAHESELRQTLAEFALTVHRREFSKEGRPPSVELEEIRRILFQLVALGFAQSTSRPNAAFILPYNDGWWTLTEKGSQYFARLIAVKSVTYRDMPGT
jgi:hypothetical protein